jgi:hypothetical protein
VVLADPERAVAGVAQHVAQRPVLRRDVGAVAREPVEDSEIEAKPLEWWLRPVRNVERVGEHSAVVCHCEYVSPLSARRCMVGISTRPPYGDQAAQPVSS